MLSVTKNILWLESVFCYAQVYLGCFSSISIKLWPFCTFIREGRQSPGLEPIFGQALWLLNVHPLYSDLVDQLVFQ